MSFADEIKRLRQKQLMSQTDFARVLGVSYITVNRWETGKSKPSYKAMKTIDSYCKQNRIDFDIGKEFIDREH